MEDANGVVEWAVGQPGVVVSGRVCAYTGYREDTAHPVHRLETPTGALSLIVSFGDGLRAQAVPDAAELSDYTSFVVGMHDRPARTAHDGHQLGIQVRLDPLGAFSLLGVPLRSSGSPSRLPIGYRTSGQLASTRTCPSFTSSSGAMCDKRSTLVRTCSARRSRRSALPIQPMWPSGRSSRASGCEGRCRGAITSTCSGSAVVSSSTRPFAVVSSLPVSPRAGHEQEGVA